MQVSGRSAETRILDVVTKGSLSLLLISAFRAPESLSSLEPVVMWMKVLIRVTVLSGLGIALLLCRRQVMQSGVLKWFAPFFLFCIWCVTSTLWSPLKSTSLGQAVSLLTLVICSLAVALIQREEEDTKSLLRWIMLNLWLICFFLLFTGLLIPATGHLTRAGLGLGHSTNAGATASLSLVLLVLSNLLWNWKWAKLLSLPGVLVFGSVAIISANRLSLVIGLLIVAVVITLFGSRQLIAASLVGIACLGTIYPIVDPQFKLLGTASETLNRGQSTDEIGSLSGRQLMWEMMWTSYLDAPLIGHGYFVSSATGALEVWYLDGELLPANWTAHNIWLQALVSTGLIGLVLFAAAVSPPFLNLAAKLCRGGRWSATETFSAVVILWYLLWSLMNESILGPVQPECVIFFAVFGTLIAHHMRQSATAHLLRAASSADDGGQIPAFSGGIGAQ